MIYILILIFSTSNGGIASSSTEFNTKEACVLAATTVQHDFPYKLDSAKCYAKGFR